MLIKKFTGYTMNEALAQVKAELGEDAVILQSRKLDKGGLLSIGGKSQVEVTAATPDRHPAPTTPEITPRKERQEKRSSRPRPDTLAPPPALLGIREYAQQTGSEPSSTFAAEPGRPRPVVMPKLGRPGSLSKPHGNDSDSFQDLRSEIEILKGSIRELSEKLAQQDMTEIGDGLGVFRESLLGNGCGSEIVSTILASMSKELKPSELEDLELLESWLHEDIASRFPTASLNELLAESNKPSVVAVVGPTGVGKTTSLAKMATNFDVFGRRKVALISTDTYRVAAVEQLRTFASIAGLPMDVVYRAEELPSAIERYRDYDIVLLDTAGRSQNDEEALSELAEFVEMANPTRTVLTLSANTRLDDQREVIQKYRKLKYTDIMLTKLDEVSSAGHMLDMVAATMRTPWTYLTTGQAVPDDIIQADAYLLAAMVVRKEYFLHLRAQAFTMMSD